MRNVWLGTLHRELQFPPETVSEKPQKSKELTCSTTLRPVAVLCFLPDAKKQIHLQVSWFRTFWILRFHGKMKLSDAPWTEDEDNENIIHEYEPPVIIEKPNPQGSLFAPVEEPKIEIVID